MSQRNELSDGYVAEALKKDARSSAFQYSTMGLDAMLPKRPTVSAPKPNTRFLKNIIRETDNHNATLKIKELGDAARMLRGLRKPRDEGSRSGHGVDFDDGGSRRSKRRRTESPDKGSTWRSRKTPSSRSPSRKARRSHRNHRDEFESSPSHRRAGPEREHRFRKHWHEHRRDRDNDGHASRDRSHDRPRSRSSDRRGYRTINERHRRHLHRRRRQSLSESDSSNSSNETARRRRSSRERARDHSRKLPKSTSSNDLHSLSPAQVGIEKTSKNTEMQEDSDPLESIIGPKPPPSPPIIKRRGRGTLASSSGIDSRFSSSYDPSTDVRPDGDLDDDWDQALEALRDRQRWKQQGADRLRAAGFTQEEVKKWEKGDLEKNEEDVLWSKKGEGREWDRGKVIDVDGRTVLQAEWGRLKDS